MELNSSDILALVAIVISLIVAYFQWKMWKYDHRFGLDVEYYKKIFDDYLLTIIPSKRMEVFFEPSGILSLKYKEFGKILTCIRKDIRFFKYYDLDFYKLLNTKIEELDEMLVVERGKGQVSREEQAKFLWEFDYKINEFYESIFDNYLK